MEEIKFRGKRVDNGEWVYGDLVHWRNEENTMQIIDERFGCCVDEKGNIMLIEEPFCCKVVPETVGQYTGLKDKNDKEIYDGDILTAEEYPFQDEDKLSYNAEVFWHNRTLEFCICLHCVNPNKRGISDGICEGLTDRDIQFEKIGNIFDNPELLERN